MIDPQFCQDAIVSALIIFWNQPDGSNTTELIKIAIPAKMNKGMIVANESRSVLK